MENVKIKWISMKGSGVLMLIFSICLLACQPKEQTKLRIATAANMQFAMKELVANFSEKTGIACETIFSSSGKLTAQIKQGAPYNVFVSADLKYPNDLFQNGLTQRKAQIYAYGKLVLWTMQDDLKLSLDGLQTENIRHLALANPKTAPYGLAAQEVLQYHQLWKTLEPKLVFGESIAQTNQFIFSKAAEIGFTAKSVLLSPAMNGKGRWIELDPKSYSPIAQGVVLLKRDSSQWEAAQKFYDFLFSPPAKEILTNFGYEVEGIEALEKVSK